MQASALGSRGTLAKVAMGQIIFVSGAVGSLLTLANVLVSGWSALPAALPWLGWMFIGWFVLSGTLQALRRDKGAAEFSVVLSALSRDFPSDDVSDDASWQVGAVATFAFAGALTLGAVLFDGVFLSVLGVLFLVTFGASCVLMYVFWVRSRKYLHETDELVRTNEARKRGSDQLESSDVAADGRDGMYCMNCGHRLPLSARFCSECGTRTDATVA